MSLRKLIQQLWDVAENATTEDDLSNLRYSGIFKDRRFTSYNMAVYAIIICGILSPIARYVFKVELILVAVGYLAALVIAPLLGHSSSLSGKFRVLITFLMVTIIFLPVFLITAFVMDSLP